jgi:hypothetical protein
VLHYAARLRTGRASDLPKDNLLNGNLAHRLFETFFATHPDWARLDARRVDAWLDDYLPRLIAEEGALLNEAGMGVVREQVTARLRYAFGALLEHLKSADVETAIAEEWSDAPFEDVTLHGAIDLLLRTRAGREIVLDVKWGGEPYRGEELAGNRILQLATYAYMRHRTGGTGRWPYAAYFIVSTGNVLAHDASVFPRAVVFAPETPEDIATIWARAAATYRWRREQIAANAIEVNAEGTEPELAADAPANGFDTSVGPDRFDDFTWLTGWDEGE